MERAGVEWKVYCGERSEEWTLQRRVEWRLEWKERLSRPLGKLLEDVGGILSNLPSSYDSWQSVRQDLQRL